LRKPVVPPLALNLITDHLTVHNVSQRFNSLLAVWFMVQIALPFTAPLQRCDLGDLLGAARDHSAPAPRNETRRSAMPTEAESESDSFRSPLAASSLRAATSLAAASEAAFSGPSIATPGSSSAPHVQHSVIRV
jgi:hypothetical protein